MAVTITQPTPVNLQTGAAGTITVTTTGDGRISGASVAIALVASGGTAPYTWSLLAGTPAPGLNFFSDGSIRGIPQARGTALLLVRSADSASPASFADAWLSVVVS